MIRWFMLSLVLATPVHASTLGGVIRKGAPTVTVKSFPAELEIATGGIEGARIVNKFGRNGDIGKTEPEDVCDIGGPYQGFLATAGKLSIASASDFDTANGDGARKIRIVGLDSDFNSISEVVTLSGETAVETTQDFIRAHTARVTDAGSSQINQGEIIISSPANDDAVLINMLAGKGQTNCACYTIPRGKNGFVKRVHVSTNTNADVEGSLWVANYGEIGRNRRPFALNKQSRWIDNIYGGMKLTEKSDICLRINSTTKKNTAIVGGFDIVTLDN